MRGKRAKAVFPAVRRRARCRGEGGFTLVEIMIAITVAVIAAYGIYAIFTHQRKATEAQRIYNDLQTGCGFAMDQIKRELLLAGYRVSEPVSAAGLDTVTFAYWDERATNDPPFDTSYDRSTQVYYKLEANGELVRKFKRRSSVSGSYEPSGIAFAALAAPYKQTLATNVQSLDFQYFKNNNQPWSNAEPLSQIRSVVVSLLCRSAKANPLYTDLSRGVLSDRYPEVRFQSEVRLRNVDISTNPRDTQPPATPTNLRAWDPGLCDTLELAWDANTESDLAGYILYYGLAPESYSNRVRIARGPGAAGTRVGYTLTGLQPTRACATTPVTYYIRIEALDKSGNPSPRSAEISGNPRPTSITVESTTGNDTTINPTAPPAPAGFTATTPADNQIQLAWTASTTVQGLVGYRLYRSRSGADFVPVGVVEGTGNCIADERTIGTGATAFLDTGAFLDQAVLEGCTTYFYKLAAIHCDNCMATADMHFSAAAATTVDTTRPPCPTITAHDGWRRIILRLENPLRATTKDFAFAKVWYSTSGVPIYDDHGTPGNPADDTVSGDLIPDSQVAGAQGTFTEDGTVTINFDSESVADPGPPALALNTTYYFLTVGYDTCGNPCTPLNSTSSQTKGDQCADCLLADPCYGGPSPASSLAATAGCGENVTLAWSPPSTIVHPDFSGFHVYRCPQSNHTACAASDWTELTSGYVWDPIFTDTKAQGLTEGAVYSYRIRSTDCYYEDHHLTWPTTGDPENDPRDNYQDAFLDNISIGRIERAVKFPGPSARFEGLTEETGGARVSVSSDEYLAANFPSPEVSGPWTIIVGEEILDCTGVDGPTTITPGVSTVSYFTACTRGAEGTSQGVHLPGDLVLPNPSSVSIQALSGSLEEQPPSFLHNTVEFWVDNTAAGSLTLTTLSPSWENANAFLQGVALGDDNTTPTTSVWSDAGSTLSHGYAGSTLTLTNAVLSPLDREIPIDLTFLKADRMRSGECGMREENLTLDLGYRNDATGDTTCGSAVSVRVPLGPYFYGTTQDMPSTGTLAWAVPGDSGSNPMNTVLVPGQQMVNVYTNVSDSDYAGIKQVRLYYYVDAAKAFGAAPALASTARYDTDPALDNLAPYVRIDLEAIAGNQWRTPPDQGIPASNDANVWFFLVAVDNNGNFDREPEPGSGAFQYYQQPYDVCQNTPKAPALAGSTTTTTVSLSWTAPLLNTNGTSWTDAGGYRIYRKTLSTGPVLLATVGPGTLTYVDTPPEMSTETYSYYVTAYDSCTLPAANESATSNWFTECQGAPPCLVNLHPSRSPLWSGDPGDSFTVDLTVCGKQNGVSGEVIYAQACSAVDANPIRLIEEGDEGLFQIDASAYAGRSAVKIWRTLPSGATDLDLRTGASDTVTVRGYGDAAGGGWGSTCDTSLSCAAALAVSGDPCASPVRPSAPRNLTISIGSSVCRNGDNGPVNLGWQAPTTGPVSAYWIYRCKGSGCTPVKIGSVSGSTLAYTDINAGAALKYNLFTYAVRAVNLICPTNTLTSDAAQLTEQCR